MPTIAAFVPLTAGLFLRFRFSGSMLFAGSFHLPHSQRDDRDEVWQVTVHELHDSMSRIRHQDHVLLGIDANLELCMPCDGSFSSACLRTFVRSFGLEFTTPGSRTWWNHAQSRKIDFILYGGPKARTTSQGVCEQQGKSCGTDGISYELLQVVVNSEASAKFLDFLNSAWTRKTPVPPSWYEGQATFLPKTKKPKEPKDLRPIILSPTICKLFTKVLLCRMQDTFPEIKCGQLCAMKGCQTLDGSMSLLRLIHLSNRWGLPLLACKLDITAAFDTLDHSAIGRFFTACRPSAEALFLQDLISNSSVRIGMLSTSWPQMLNRGIMQGSSYSAELFARVLDWHLHSLVLEWSQKYPSNWFPSLHLILYADDILLLAASEEEMQFKLQGIHRHLELIGLRLATHKCQLISSPHCSAPRILHPSSVPVQVVQSFVFLGILVGFAVTPEQILSRSLTRAMHAFWGHYGILKACRTAVSDRLMLLTAFVASRWRWMSPAIRPTTRILRLLETCHTNLLMMICNPARDPLCGVHSDWISRRRAARMIGQYSGQAPWPAVHVQQFAGYWGHAARMTHAWSPISKVLTLRDIRWQMVHSDVTRTRGNRPDITLFLQRFWDDHGRDPLRAEPLFWTEVAQDRNRWKEFIACLLGVCGYARSLWFPDLSLVDLHERQLLVVGKKFLLLPMRHFPIEELYESSICVVPDTDAYHDLSGWVVATDGSCRSNIGGFAVVIQPPGADQLLIRRGYIPSPCTNTKAELIALQVACDMVRVLQSRIPEEHSVTLLTDSQFCLQLMYGACMSTSNPLQVSALVTAWSKIADRTSLRHVKSHTGQFHNEVADTHAKLALLDPGRKQVTFMQHRPDIDIPSDEAWLRRMRSFVTGCL